MCWWVTCLSPDVSAAVLAFSRLIYHSRLHCNNLPASALVSMYESVSGACVFWAPPLPLSFSGLVCPYMEDESCGVSDFSQSEHEECYRGGFEDSAVVEGVVFGGGESLSV